MNCNYRLKIPASLTCLLKMLNNHNDLPVLVWSPDLFGQRFGGERGALGGGGVLDDDRHWPVSELRIF